MILLHFRVHRTRVEDCFWTWRSGRRIAFQCHAALRTIARHVRLHPRAHRAEIVCGCGWRRHGGCGLVVRMRINVAAAAITRITRRLGFRFGATNPAAFSLSRSSGFAGAYWTEEFLPAVLGAKVMGLPVTFSAERRGCVHRHSTNGIFGHTFPPGEFRLAINCLHSQLLTQQRETYY